MQEFRVVQLSDPHLSATRAYYLDNWHLAAEWVEKACPDLVAVTGDLILSDPDEEADHRFARRLCDALAVPCRFIPGNHDIGDNVVSGHMAQRVNEARLARFRRIFGEDRWTVRAAGWTLIALNAQILGSGGMDVEAEQWRWLENVLAAADGDAVALFLHKPVFLDHPSEADHEEPAIRQSCIDSESRRRLLDLAQRYGVRLIAAGHKHQTRAFAHDGIYYIWAPSVACVNGAPDAFHWGRREVGFVEFRFRPDGFRHRIVGTDFLFCHESYVRKREYGAVAKAPAQHAP